MALLNKIKIERYDPRKAPLPFHDFAESSRSPSDFFFGTNTDRRDGDEDRLSLLW